MKDVREIHEKAMMNNGMDELGLVIRDSRIVVSSRDVARVFEKDHSKVLRDIRELACSEAFSQANFGLASYNDEQGKSRPEYMITRDGFTMLAMGFTGSRAMAFKERYIAAFNRMEAELANRAPYGRAVPRSFAEALQLAADIEKKRAELAAKAAQDAPKVLFADSVAASHTDILIGDMAKLLRQNGVEIGQRRLFEWLRENGYLMKAPGLSWNMPTQRAMELKLFRVKETTINKPDGTIQLTKTTKVTGKGQIYFVQKFLSSLGIEPETGAVPAV